jgi:serine/threonine protein kinase/Flp pilus assembly protein TadD
MPNATPSLDTIVCEAVEIADAADRAVFLDRACGGDDAFRQRVEALVAAHFRAGGSFLEGPAEAPVATASFTPGPEEPGTMIGPYKLLERIGEGGMGVVYVAEQTEPVRRRVALKVIKPGMDTREVVARFEAERQALALMDHPNIAKVLDGGATGGRGQGSGVRGQESGGGVQKNSSLPPDPCLLTPGFGRPYFVMELVRGLPITDYCDQARLPADRRLRLFTQVCRAVQHAHQKGVIHRDLKPSNILVTLHDGEPVPKVIDFGIAKAMNQRLTDKTVYTRLTQFVGTPQYMSPEQAELSGLDIDTRSDVYSLGVLLYELLTGTTPFDPETFRRAGLDEVRRMIREDEPPRPSARVSTLDAAARSTASSRRGLDERQLGRLLRGDLDWIVMRALEKDRNRRYESAGEFAADVERYLANEPVEARPPSSWYRVQKFARRNKAGVAVTAVVAAALTLLTWGIGYVIRDRSARLTQVERAVNEALREAEFFQGQARWPDALAAARRAEALLESGGSHPALRQRVGEALADLTMVAKLEEVLLLPTAAVREDLFDWRLADVGYLTAFREYGIDVTALPPEKAAERVRARAIRGELVAALDVWAPLRMKSDEKGGRHLLAVARAADPDDGWRNELRDALARKERGALEELAAAAATRNQPPAILARLGVALHLANAHEASVALLRKAQALYPGDFWINHGLAFSLAQMQPPRSEEAIRFHTAALALRPSSPGVYLNFGKALETKGALDEAIAAYREAILLKSDYSTAHGALGNALHEKGLLDEAIAAYREAIRLKPEDAGGNTNLGNALEEKGLPDEAITVLRNAIRLQPDLAMAHNNLGVALKNKGLLDEAIAEFREALRLNPKFALALTNHGDALCRKGLLDEAIAAHREAIRLKPDLTLAHGNLGLALGDKGLLDDAIAAYREAVRLNPDRRGAHVNIFNLGRALGKKGFQAEAIAAYREAIRIKPDLAEAHCNMGNILLLQENFAEALAFLRRGHELGSKNPSWKYPSAGWVESAERLAAMGSRLSAVVRGDAEPADSREALEVLAHCYKKRLTVKTAQLYTRYCRTAWAKEPGSAANTRFIAAQAAALAGCGRGEDAAALGEAERAGWRSQALEWLQADLVHFGKRLTDSRPAARKEAQDYFNRRKQEPALAGVRDATELAKLPEAERAEWVRFWSAVQTALAKARGPAAKAN